MRSNAFNDPKIHQKYIFFEYIEQLTKNYYEAVISNVKEKKY